MRAAPPLVAITGYVDVPASGEEPRVSLRDRYARAVQAAGGLPVVVPPVGGAAHVRRLVARVDALLITGGDDFDMERLGRGATHAAATRTFGPKQDHDFELLRAASDAGLPVLGICYGMQLLCLDAGGELLQHLPDDRPRAQPHSGDARHDVAVVPGTKLSAVLSVEHLEVISRHHQAISDPGLGLAVSARDGEGLIEAVERPGHPYCIGVQWHPELSPARSPHGRLFRALVAAAAERRNPGLLPAEPGPA